MNFKVNYIEKYTSSSEFNHDKGSLGRPYTVNFSDTIVKYSTNIVDGFRIDYLTFKAYEDGTFKSTSALSYSIDGGDWVSLAANTNTPTVKAGSFIRWKATLTPTTTGGCGTFSSTGKFVAMGSPYSLIGDQTLGENPPSNGFYAMFSGCTTITSAKNIIIPRYNDSSIGDNCCEKMFYGCTNLLECMSHNLSNEGCYKEMYVGCTSLTGATLYGTTLSPNCYNAMFSGCTNLSYIKCLATDGDSTSTQNWLDGVATAGTFIRDCGYEWTEDSVDGIPSGWDKDPTECGADPTKMLTIKAKETCSVAFSGSNFNNRFVSYSMDGGNTWTRTRSGATNSVEIPAGGSMILSGVCPDNRVVGRIMFSESGSCSLEGNPYSLISGASCASVTTAGATVFANLFDGDTGKTFSGYYYNQSLKDASKLALPYTTLGPTAFNRMFNHCHSLEKAPQISATTLNGTRALECMFYSCSALTTPPPVIPVTAYTGNIGQSACSQMFMNCYSLTTAPELPATAVTASTYYQMFQGCSGLTTAPVLPATTLVANCYYQMFYGCSSLNYIKAMFTTTPGSYTQNWVRGVAASGTFVKNSAGWSTGTTACGVNTYPCNWTVRTESS